MTDSQPPSTNWFHPTQRPYRFTVLLFASLITSGSYFAYDSVGAIPDQLMRKWGVDQASIGSLYSAYSLSAILTLLFGGILIDRIGTRKSSLLFSVVVTMGAALVAFAPNIQVAYAGRFLFGAGSESLITAQNAILARWFKGKELALAFGVTLTICRLGTLFSFNSEALIAERFSPGMALWAAVLFCGVSLLTNLVFVFLDRRGERALGLANGAAGDRIVFQRDPLFLEVVLVCHSPVPDILFGHLPFYGSFHQLFRRKMGAAQRFG